MKFNKWWRNVGSRIAQKSNEDQEMHVMRVALEAWRACVDQKRADEELINGLMHLADDHPCCRGTIMLAIARIQSE